MASGFVTAWAMFTVIPAPAVDDFSRPACARGMRMIPVIGLCLGLLAGTAAALVELLDGGRLLTMAAGLAVLALTNGCFHLDGLADTADGLGSRKPPDEALRIMKKSDIGPMGVVAVVGVLALELAAAASPHLAGWRGVWALVTMPMVARTGAVLASRRGVPAAPTSSLGRLFADLTTPATLALDLAGVLVVSAVSGWLLFGVRTAIAAVVACALAWLVEALWQRHLLARLGGITGDVFGSLIELTGLAYLLTVAVTA
ncbi:adenosylcobinamide-GDP ribazoletransferase [Propionibacterium australiense]|uniref:Adenosylcobinamide-GDP ribazoletransferase n=1 Tax=Propionibacterium australiense TaxID=119981 RepID=A0A383S8K8_9ACTN|nr:adenosylcobinamide-GDP ribazoletransferase [Propionibacterium australiense]RLP06870.1 adenosylcobinamide-GDP ribazoletransferase [Propionibacterium australiense]RLP08860.1 adenosylcobinamide-GDP ribazoletransferase [Propionibacterium australiense]SYZ34330.1 adenosylcobinamide-GDP ribazoletransferase [Propionibacterium australiense]VEH90076.1 cobalamin synthase [Propionibacterium australiense]